MNVLLDTHTLIWFSISPNRLSERIINLLSDADNNLFLSIASIWEMQIKLQLGKLNFDLPLPELIENQKQTNGLQILPIELSHKTSRYGGNERVFRPEREATRSLLLEECGFNHRGH